MLLNAAFASTPLDKTSLPQSSLDIVARIRTNPLPWAGQFSPQLIEELLGAYASSHAVVLDPFVGSGTTLGEAARIGLTAFGSDVNPAAIVLARVYRLVNLTLEERKILLHEACDRMLNHIGSPNGSLFKSTQSHQTDRSYLEAGLIEFWRKSRPGHQRCVAAALVVLSDFHRENLDLNVIHKMWLRLQRTIYSLPMSDAPIIVHHSDARELLIKPGTIDLVVTSPPYINVHNYHQKFRRSVEALQCDVLSIAKSEIGSNRQNRSNRFLTVIQYSLDMALSLRSMAIAAKPGARIILIVGRESSVRGTRFFNGELVAEIAVQCIGMQMKLRQERVFQNRYGIDIYEDILHFNVEKDVPEESYILKTARRVAREVLVACRAHTPPEELFGVNDAIARLDDVLPSPKPMSESLSSLLE